MIRGAFLVQAAFCTAVAFGQGKSDGGPSYDGKYKSFSPFKTIVAKLPALRDKALAAIHDRLGLSIERAGRIRIELRDALADDGEVIQRFSGPPFRTSWDGEDPVITLFTEFLVNGRFDAETEVVHELTHAVTRLHMKPEAYKGVPDWIREGLAVWTAEQVDGKTAYLLRTPDEPVKLGDLLVGLEGGEDTPERYAEYGLAIEMIEKKHGPDAVKGLARRIIEGKPARMAVEEATGRRWADFAAAAREYARGRLERLAPPQLDTYFELRKADKQRDYKTVITTANALLKANPRSPLNSSILYWKGKACRMEGKSADAEKALHDLMTRGERASEWIEGGLYQLGKARVEAGKFQEALEPWKRVLRDHPDSELQDNALYYLALCRAKTGKKADARKLLDAFDRSFKTSDYAQKAVELRRTLK